MDRYVYSKIADSICRRSGACYRIVTAEELSGSGGGKLVLLGFFDYLRKKDSLLDRFEGKMTASIFIMDKDVDDWLRTRRRSSHVVYTETYELENYLFVHGDLSEAAAASASLDIRSVRTGFGDSATWCFRMAEKWKEWTQLCIYSQTRRIDIGCGYRRSVSRVNNGICGPLDKVKHKSFLLSLQQESGLAPEQFKRSFNRVSRKVDQIYSEKQHHSVFKGSWYAQFFREEIKRIAGSKHYNKSGLCSRRILSSLAQTLEFEDAWTECFGKPMGQFLALIGSSSVPNI